MSECKYCKESKYRKLLKVEVTYFYENPEAYGFPEIVYWNEKHNLKYCPICGRKLEKENE
jgi:hypothetical protein